MPLNLIDDLDIFPKKLDLEDDIGIFKPQATKGTDIASKLEDDLGIFKKPLEDKTSFLSQPTTKTIFDIATAGLSIPFTRIPGMGRAWELAHEPEEKLRKTALQVRQNIKAQIPEALKPILEPTIIPQIEPTKKLSEYEKQFQDMAFAQIASLPASPEAWAIVGANIAMRLPTALKAELGKEALNKLGSIAARRGTKPVTISGDVYDYIVQKTPYSKLRTLVKSLGKIAGPEPRITTELKGAPGFARVPAIPPERGELIKQILKLSPEIEKASLTALPITQLQARLSQLQPTKPLEVEAKKYKTAEEFVKSREKKLTTRIERLEGVERAEFDANIQKLTIFKGKDVSTDTINIRINKALSDAQLQASVKDIDFVNIPKEQIGTTPKTKQQLTDIWEKAQEAPILPKTPTLKGVKPIISEYEKTGSWAEIRTEIEIAEAGKRMPTETGEWIGIPSTFPEYVKGKGWTKKEITIAMEKAGKGEKLALRQEDIINTLLEEAERRTPIKPSVEVTEEFLPKEVDEIIEGLDKESQKKLVEETNRYLERIGKPSILKVKDVKKVIREQTGQIKVKNIIEIVEEEALKEQIRREAFTARKAFAVGREEGIVRQKAYQAEISLRKKMRTEASAETKKLLNTIKNVDISKMSPAQAEPIKAIQSIVDFAKPTTKTFHRLTGIRTYLEANPEAELPDYVYEDLERLEKLNRSDMTLDQLRSLANTVAHHAHLEKTKNTIKVRMLKRQAKEVLIDSIVEMKPALKVKSDIVESQKSKVGKFKNIGKLVKDTFGIRHDHYDLVIETLAGSNSTIDKVLFQEVKEGINKQLEYRQGAYKQFQKDLIIENFLKKHEIKDIGSWLNERVKIGKFNLTRGERMALYRHSLNDNNLRHILNGGFALKYSDSPFLAHQITAEELNAILSSLNDAEKEFAGEPLTKLFDRQHEALNKVFYEKNGYPLPKETDYYPIEVMKAALPKDLEAESILEELKHKWVRIGLKKGMLENRRKSKLPIYLNNIAYDINKSVMNSAAYIGLEMPLTNASKLLYNKVFKHEMFNRYGQQAWLEIDKGLRDIAGDWQSYSTTEKLLLKAKNNLSTAILGLNPFVMAKQILSFALYNVYVKPQYLLQGYMDYISHPFEMIERHKTYSPEYTERIEGGYSRDVADVFKSRAMKRIYKGKGSIKEKLMGGIKLFDSMAVNPGMQGAVLQVLDELKVGELSPEIKVALDITEADISKLSPEDKMKLAYKFADYTTERTQPMFSPEHRSSLSRGSAVEKLATQFSSFTNQALNLTRRIWRRALDAGDPEMYTKLAKVLFLLLVVNTGGVMAINEIRDRIYRKAKRVKRGIGAKYGEAVLDSIASYFYFIRDLERSVVSKIKRGTFTGYDINLPVLSAANTLADGMADGIGALTEKSYTKKKKRAGKFIDNALEIILMLNGIPYQTPKKLIMRGGKGEKDFVKEIEQKYGGESEIADFVKEIESKYGSP